MNLTTILQKAWQMLWNYRSLWLFGAALALVGASMFIPGPLPDPEDDAQWIKIKLSEYSTIRVPGMDMTIDFTAPGDVRIITPDGISWREFRDLVDELNREDSINLWPILIEFAVMFFVFIMLGLLARYIAETALIRMVNDGEETGKRLGIWAGIRRGFSYRAGRLFLLDLLIGIVAAIATIVVLGLAFAPIVLLQRAQGMIILMVGLGTTGLLILAFFVWLVASVLLSLVMQPVRRAVVLEDQGLLASIRQGFRVISQHLKEVGLLWLIWMGIRLLWIPLSVLIAICLAPVLLMTLLLGTLLGGMQAILVAAIAELFWGGATPWIFGVLAGLPVFVIVTILPMLFVTGLVEIYKSCIWTLGYRDLRSMERKAPVAELRGAMQPIPGPAD